MTLPNTQCCNSAIPFPWKLHLILEYAEANDLHEIVCWTKMGNGFKVHKPAVFDERIMPLYFNQTKYKSFQRQLNMWGFERVNNGSEKGSYTHPCFVRGKPEACQRMKRTKIKGIHSKRLRPSGLAPGLLVPSVSSMSNGLDSTPYPKSEVTLMELQQVLSAWAKQKMEIEARLGAALNAVSAICSGPSNSNEDLEPRPLPEDSQSLFEGRSFYSVSGLDSAAALGSLVNLPSVAARNECNRICQPARVRSSRRFSLQATAPSCDHSFDHNLLKLEQVTCNDSVEESLDEIWSALVEVQQPV